MLTVWKHLLPDVFSVLQHGQADGAFLVHVGLLLPPDLELQGLSLLAGQITQMG